MVLNLVLIGVAVALDPLPLTAYAVARPGPSQALLARFRTWIDSHTDQVIIAGSLIIGYGSSPTACT